MNLKAYLDGVIGNMQSSADQDKKDFRSLVVAWTDNDFAGMREGSRGMVFEDEKTGKILFVVVKEPYVHDSMLDRLKSLGYKVWREDSLLLTHILAKNVWGLSDTYEAASIEYMGYEPSGGQNENIKKASKRAEVLLKPLGAKKHFTEGDHTEYWTYKTERIYIMDCFELQDSETYLQAEA